MNFYTTQMRSGPAAIAGPLLALALIFPACGEEESAATGAESATDATVTKAERGARPSERHLALRTRCRNSLGEFLDAIESLNNTVAVGLDYKGYLTMVKRVRATYAEIDAGRLPLLCLARAATPAEAALNAYIAAANTWGECLADASCEIGEVEPRLQRKWARASGLVGRAQAGLR